ncbi:MAG: hypothetical protein JXX14_10395 [Deltaproteobacteria bacterium]|nr:hypothetical protein [Deltaproteobacteria bacterium]
MSTAKKIKTPAMDPGIYADIFIDEMREQTGCSDHFLAEARPSLIKLYRDVTGEPLETCLNDIRELIQQQADTERICAQARKDAIALEQTQRQLDSELKSMHRQVTDMRNTLRATAFTLFSMKGNRPIGDA